MNAAIICGGRSYGRVPAEPYDYERAARWCEENGIPFRVYPADWAAHGNAAGPIRNKAMLEAENPSCVIAFPGSKGTRSMVGLAEKAGVRVIKVDWA